MKLLHISDLHLGRKMNDVNLLPEQDYVLSEIVDIAVNNKVDAILICGDIYNNTSPQPEAMTVFNNFLTSIMEAKIKTFIISGNHDSDERVSYLSSIVKNSGIYISEKFKGTLQTYDLYDEYGKLTISLLPFIKPAQVRRFYPTKKIVTFNDAVSVIIKNHVLDEKGRNILLAHQFITGAEYSDVEELAIGGLDNIDAAIFDAFDYVALGHIHKAQKVKRSTLRYSGSIMKYSFSEETHQKSVTLVEIKEKGSITYELIPLAFKHELYTIKGLFADIMNHKKTDDFVRIILTDEEILPNARTLLYSIFPNMMSFMVENSKTKENPNINNNINIEQRSVIDLFKDFYKLQHNDKELTPKHIKILESIIKEIKEE